MTSTNDTERNKLVTEHAALATQYAATQNEGDRTALAEKLKTIEAQLGLTAAEIAELAIQSYKRQY